MLSCQEAVPVRCKVPFVDLRLQHRRLREQIEPAVLEFLRRGYYVGGPALIAFEEAFARYAGAADAIGVGNGTDAIALALRSVGVRPGDEVIVPALSAYPTTVGVVQMGAVPRFCDVGPEDGLIDPAKIATCIGPKTRAILPVHLYGAPCDMVTIAALAKTQGLKVVEDCAQAHGARLGDVQVGGFGDAAAWSFYPTKNLGAAGDAGAVTTDCLTRAAHLRRLRNYGQTDRYQHAEPGVNSRLDPLQATILQVKLGHLEADTQQRRRLAARYRDALASQLDAVPLHLAADAASSCHLFPVRLAQPARRQVLRDHLAADNVETLIHYPIPMPAQEATLPAWREAADCPQAAALCASLLSLPLHPDLTLEQVDFVVYSLKRFFSARQ